MEKVEIKTDLNTLCINTIRFLAVDAIEKANSGHPGMPMGAAPMGYVLWTKFLKHNPKNPKWFNRDRFVLSAGHGSMLLYSLLHLTGYDLSLDDIKNFRQLKSKTPGHPEYDLSYGVECTTGPLGQGFAMGIGMAMAEKFLSERFNRKGFPIVDHSTYSIVSDGDLMEGVSSEAASLAGHLKLGKVIYLYDDNEISIDGSTDLAFTEDPCRRFEAYGWHVQKVEDGNDLNAISSAIEDAQRETSKPSLIAVRTHIGYGSPKQDTASAHGEPLGLDAVKAAKENLEWPLEPLFHIPEDVLNRMRGAVENGVQKEEEWSELFGRYKGAFPKEGGELESWRTVQRTLRGEMDNEWLDGLLEFGSSDSPIATRAASGKVLNRLSDKIHNLVGGSADLAPSNKTIQTTKEKFGFNGKWGHNIHFGVSEHAMGSVTNGMALHGGVIPYSGTFLVFSDYMRPAIRLSALMKIQNIFVFTHDSIHLGEDGPTHQPIEHLMSLRTIPNLRVIRPADANETAVAWQLALEHSGPTVLIFTRQKLPVFETTNYPIIEGVPKGAYVLFETGNQPDIILVATGSEVHLAIESAKELKKQGINSRVVSLPCWELFDEQSEDYKKSILPVDISKLSLEAGSTLGWKKYVGDSGDVLGLERFGESAPGQEVYQHLGFTAESVVERVVKLLG